MSLAIITTRCQEKAVTIVGIIENLLPIGVTIELTSASLIRYSTDAIDIAQSMKILSLIVFLEATAWARPMVLVKVVKSFLNILFSLF